MSNGNQRRQCAFQLLRYVPDVVRNEFVHIGVLLRDEDGALELKLTRDWRRVRCLDPDADTALLEGMEEELKKRLSDDPDGKMRKILDEALSLSVQMTEPKAYLAESLDAGLRELMRMYVEMPKRERVSQLRGRAAIQATMRDAFDRARVWDLMRKGIKAAEYTRPGDPLRIDAGYRCEGGQVEVGIASEFAPLIRMFHAVSLEPGVEMAKVLAFSAAGLRAGIERVEKTRLELTAIIEPAEKIGANEDAPEKRDMYRFGVETMEEHAIRVLTTADLPRVAETARRELGVG